MGEQHQIVYGWSRYCEIGAVIVDGTVVYHEDDDKGYHQHYTAEEVANDLGEALKVKPIVVRLSVKAMQRLNMEVEGWNFDGVYEMVMARVTHGAKGRQEPAQDTCPLLEVIKELEEKGEQ